MSDNGGKRIENTHNSEQKSDGVALNFPGGNNILEGGNVGAAPTVEVLKAEKVRNGISLKGLLFE